MRREERVTVQGPVKEQQPDGMSHRGGMNGAGDDLHVVASNVWPSGCHPKRGACLAVFCVMVGPGCGAAHVVHAAPAFKEMDGVGELCVGAVCLGHEDCNCCYHRYSCFVLGAAWAELEPFGGLPRGPQDALSGQHHIRMGQVCKGVFQDPIAAGVRRTEHTLGGVRSQEFSGQAPLAAHPSLVVCRRRSGPCGASVNCAVSIRSCAWPLWSSKPHPPHRTSSRPVPSRTIQCWWSSFRRWGPWTGRYIPQPDFSRFRGDGGGTRGAYPRRALGLPRAALQYCGAHVAIHSVRRVVVCQAVERNGVCPAVLGWATTAVSWLPPTTENPQPHNPAAPRHHNVATPQPDCLTSLQPTDLHSTRPQPCNPTTSQGIQLHSPDHPSLREQR